MSYLTQVLAELTGREEDPLTALIDHNMKAMESAPAESQGLTPAYVPDVYGTAFDDFMFNIFHGKENLHALGGNDLIYQSNQGGTVYAGSGADIVQMGVYGGTVFGEAGNDLIHGSYDTDIIYGGDGNDRLEGNGDNDELYGGSGNDTIMAGSGDDESFGGAGNDVLEGEYGDDTSYGGDGNDIIGGGDGNDDLNGGRGDDILFGDAGADTMNGGEGDNTIVFRADGDSVIFDESDEGENTLVLDAWGPLMGSAKVDGFDQYDDRFEIRTPGVTSADLFSMGDVLVVRNEEHGVNMQFDGLGYAFQNPAEAVDEGYLSFATEEPQSWQMPQYDSSGWDWMGGKG